MNQNFDLTKTQASDLRDLIDKMTDGNDHNQLLTSFFDLSSLKSEKNQVSYDVKLFSLPLSMSDTANKSKKKKRSKNLASKQPKETVETIQNTNKTDNEKQTKNNNHSNSSKDKVMMKTSDNMISIVLLCEDYTNSSIHSNMPVSCLFNFDNLPGYIRKPDQVYIYIYNSLTIEYTYRNIFLSKIVGCQNTVNSIDKVVLFERKGIPYLLTTTFSNSNIYIISLSKTNFFSPVLVFPHHLPVDFISSYRNESILVCSDNTLYVYSILNREVECINIFPLPDPICFLSYLNNITYNGKEGLVITCNRDGKITLYSNDDFSYPMKTHTYGGFITNAITIDENTFAVLTDKGRYGIYDIRDISKPVYKSIFKSKDTDYSINNNYYLCYDTLSTKVYLGDSNSLYCFSKYMDLSLIYDATSTNDSISSFCVQQNCIQNKHCFVGKNSGIIDMYHL
ncbi:hypothetical protein WA158_002182 [Blastocystis sp. Blastoise]